MNAMSPITAASAIPSALPGNRSAGLSPMRQAFQDSVGGIFYGEMIKALRSGVGKPAYLHGGQAEEMFQTQLDQKVAADLARNDGGQFIESLYQRFLVDHPESPTQQSSQLSMLTQTAKSASSVESAQELAWARPVASVSGNTTGTGVISALNRK